MQEDDKVEPEKETDPPADKEQKESVQTEPIPAAYSPKAGDLLRNIKSGQFVRISRVNPKSVSVKLRTGKKGDFDRGSETLQKDDLSDWIFIKHLPG